ncbi:MAG: hypothetical protein JWN45_1279 [Acidobacteriaceae bacterium]|nr:hypothetical protein [Acidobacteriaceae bacterium]
MRSPWRNNDHGSCIRQALHGTHYRAKRSIGGFVVDPRRSGGDHSSSRPDNTQRWASTTRISVSSEHIPSCRRPTNKGWNFLSNSYQRVRSRPISTSCNWAILCFAARSPRAASPSTSKADAPSICCSPPSPGSPRLSATCAPMYKDWQSGNNPMPGNHQLYCL